MNFTYAIQDQSNMKYYIGSTGQPTIEKFNQYIRAKAKKWGITDYKRSILKMFDTRLEACQYEVDIQIANSVNTNPNYYNTQIDKVVDYVKGGESQKAFNKTPEGKAIRKQKRELRKKRNKTPEGIVSLKLQGESHKAFNKTPEGIAIRKQAGEKTSETLKATNKTPEGIAIRKQAGETRKAFDKTSEGIAIRKQAGKKISETLKAVNKTPEGIASRKQAGEKTSESRKAFNKTPKGIASLKQQGEKKKLNDKLNAKTCPYCGTVMDPANYAKHHGENCKLKGEQS